VHERDLIPEVTETEQSRTTVIMPQHEYLTPPHFLLQDARRKVTILGHQIIEIRCPRKVDVHTTMLIFGPVR
jgi:hypothetical protein